MLGNKAAALVRGHGYVAVGSIIPEAVHRSSILDVNARMPILSKPSGCAMILCGAAICLFEVTP